MKNVLLVTISLLTCFISVRAGQFTNPPRPSEPVALQVDAAGNLIKRLLPKHANQFVLEAIGMEDGNDVFEIESVNGKIVLRGNSGVSIASALNWYLKYTCNCQVAWSGNQLDLPEHLPVVNEKIRHVSPYKFRSYLNYCVFNYTMSWWDWDRWEREIDWMALNGITMPLMTVGQEATWLATFKRYGLTDEQMQKFFVGPAYFAWHWMTNIDSVGGPLPMSWIKSHQALGQKILKRQRQLGMTPILQAFTGHVPKAFLDKHPQVKAQQEKSWSLLSPGTYQMDPLDPLFDELGTAFIEEQTKIFGTDHLYAADPFHEGHPPVKGDKYLNDVGKAIYKTRTSADKEAVWVKQSWSFREAILSPIPDYSTRSWNGMYSGYYAKRWEGFIKMLKDKFARSEYDYTDHNIRRVFGRPHFEPELPFYQKQLAFEKKWVRSHDKYPSKPTGDTIIVAKKLAEKYYPKILKSYELAEAGKYPANISYRYVKPKAVVKKTNVTSGKPVTTNGGTERSDLGPEKAVDGIIVNRLY